MKKIVEVSGEGLEGLLGEKVTLFCLNYFYTGKLTGVNEHDVALTDPAIVYDTGEWSKDTYSDVQSLPCSVLYVRTRAIESYGVVK